MRKEIRDHRTKKIIIRKFPLFAGYAFVGVPSMGSDFYSLAQCTAVVSILGINGEPAIIPAATIEQFRAAEADMKFDDTKGARIKRRQEGRTMLETIKMHFPEGLQVRVKGDRFDDHPFAGFHGHVVGVTGRGMVNVMIGIFGRLTPVEIKAVDLEAA